MLKCGLCKNLTDRRAVTMDRRDRSRRALFFLAAVVKAVTTGRVTGSARNGYPGPEPVPG